MHYQAFLKSKIFLEYHTFLKSKVFLQNRHAIILNFLIFSIDKLQPPTTTFLKPNHYQTLFVEYGRSNWCHRETYTYRTPAKQVWSITPNFPDNLHIRVRPGITQELAPF